MTDLKEALMAELAYCRHINLPVSETADRIAAMVTRKHTYWSAGETECPSEIKAGNGEITKLLCKVCGDVNTRSRFCLPDTTHD